MGKKLWARTQFRPTKPQKDAIWDAFAPFADQYRREFLAVAGCVLLHQGKSKKYITNFIKAFGQLYFDNCQFYKYTRNDAIWVCFNELRENGIDIGEIERQQAEEEDKEPEAIESEFTDAEIQAVMSQPDFKWSEFVDRLKALRNNDG